MMMSKIKASVWTLGLALGMMGPASAALFDAGLPAGWTANGNAGTLGANGVVTLAPSGGSQYGYVSSNNGVNGVALPGVGGSGVTERFPNHHSPCTGRLSANSAVATAGPI